MYTTGLLSKVERHNIVLYFTGRKHAGENLDDFLDKRTVSSPMIIMSDALSCNNPKRHEAYSVLCNTHARRNFVDLQDKYKEESEFVLELIGEIYKFEHETVKLK